MDRALLRAGHLLDLDRYAEAETLIRARLTETPESAEALRMLTLALLGQDRSAEAEAAARGAVQSDPAEEHGHRLLSIALFRQDRAEEAVLSATTAVRLAPGLWETHYTLGQALRAGRRPRVRDALACANQAVRLAPHESAPHNLAGLCLDDLNLADEAVKAYSEALRLDPTSAIALNNLAASRLEGGKLTDATRLLTSGLALDPQEKYLHQNYDALLLRLIRRLYFALLGLGALLALLAGVEAPYVARVGTVVVLLAIYVVLARRVTTQLPRGARLWTRGLLRRQGWMERIAVMSFLLVTVGVVVIGLAPREIALITGLVILRGLQFGGVIVIIGALVGAVTGRFRR